MNVRVAEGTSIGSLALGNSVDMERFSGADGDTATAAHRKLCKIVGCRHL